MRKTIKKLYNTIIWFPKLLFFYFLRLFDNRIVFCECYVKFRGTRFRKNNWGDDINKYLFEYISNKRFVFLPYKHSYLPRIKHYSMIGSIIGSFDLTKTTIYGSGIMKPSKNIKGKPDRILSVRGPLTREILISKGFDCPESYGDPAMLARLFYNPQKNKRYKVSFIPNHASLGVPIVSQLVSAGFHLIDMTTYDNWTDIIDQIVESEFVVSESLHGIIVSETYDIPSVWVEFMDHGDYWDFKYLDFYASIGKKGVQKTKVIDEGSFTQVYPKLFEWKKGKINYKELLNVLPFEYDSSKLIHLDV